MSEWQPISSAPKDGSLIIVTTGERTGVARWSVVARRDTLNDDYSSGMAVAVFANEYGWRSASDKTLTSAPLKYWMPLPPLPAQSP